VADAGGYRISVKLEPGGTGSAFLHGHVHPGDVVDAAAPRGSFVLHDGDWPVVLISGGVGATPVLAMLHSLVDAGDTREVWWIHGARNGAEHAFGDEVDRLLASLPNAHRFVAYSRPAPDDVAGERFDATGRITIETIERAGIPSGADYYICGPDGFMRDLSAGLTASGVPPERVSIEVFGATTATRPGITASGPARAPHQPGGHLGPGPEVTFSRSNLTVPWDPSYASLLELAEACDVPVSFSCRTGVCHSCETGLLAGEVAYVTEPLEQPEDGRVLVCCTQPAAELTLEL
jgi:ferredoxin-NADP reductase